MKKITFLVLFSMLIAVCAKGQSKDTDNLFKDFHSTEWSAVLKAKESLENTQISCIPGLIEQLDDNSVKKLINTGDLIYPGAERFFGHGQIIDYDIDKIDVRAGWLLEELTFQNFGFTGIHISPQDLSDYIKFNFPKYYNNTKNRQLIEKSTDREKREIIKKLSIDAAKKWWATEANEWNRLNALIEALQSEDEKRQARALFYIRNGKTGCDGLTVDTYKLKIAPIITELSRSPLKRISEQARLIIFDNDFEWMKIKTSL